MLMAPADWPNTVTLAGSPPKAAMLSRTHSRAATWSRRPMLACPSPRSRNPSAPTRQLITTQTTPSLAKFVPLYAAVEPISNAPPWIQTITGRPRLPWSGVQTLRFRQSSPARAVSHSVPALSGGASWKGESPYFMASRTPLQGWTGCGGRSRFTPAVDAANGMPRKQCTPSARLPRSWPCVVLTTVSMATTSRVGGFWPWGHLGSPRRCC
ncbi:hypothetical protein D9M72_505240 [compost metagenome]